MTRRETTAKSRTDYDVGYVYADEGEGDALERLGRRLIDVDRLELEAVSEILVSAAINIGLLLAELGRFEAPRRAERIMHIEIVAVEAADLGDGGFNEHVEKIPAWRLGKRRHQSSLSTVGSGEPLHVIRWIAPCATD